MYSLANCSFLAGECTKNKECRKRYSICKDGKCACNAELILGAKSCEPGKCYVLSDSLTRAHGKQYTLNVWSRGKQLVFFFPESPDVSRVCYI